jgi:hypothetical protein
MAKAQKIAEALTPAQQRAVRHAKWSDVMGGYHVPLSTTTAVGRVLFDKKLMRRPPGWTLNHLGEAVREHLIAKDTA